MNPLPSPRSVSTVNTLRRTRAARGAMPVSFRFSVFSAEPTRPASTAPRDSSSVTSFWSRPISALRADRSELSTLAWRTSTNMDAARAAKAIATAIAGRGKRREGPSSQVSS